MFEMWFSSMRKCRVSILLSSYCPRIILFYSLINMGIFYICDVPSNGNPFMLVFFFFIQFSKYFLYDIQPQIIYFYIRNSYS